MTQVIKGLDGKEMLLQEMRDGKIVDTGTKLTLRKVCTEALMLNNPQESVDGEEKFKRYQLALKVNISVTDEVDLSTEEITKIKRLVGASYGTGVVGPAFDMLEKKE